MNKYLKLLKENILPKLSNNKFFIDKNGKPSSKRLAGLSLVATAIMMSLFSCFWCAQVDSTLVIGLATIGASLLGMPKDQVL